MPNRKLIRSSSSPGCPRTTIISIPKFQFHQIFLPNKNRLFILGYNLQLINLFETQRCVTQRWRHHSANNNPRKLTHFPYTNHEDQDIQQYEKFLVNLFRRLRKKMIKKEYETYNQLCGKLNTFYLTVKSRSLYNLY